MFLFFGQKIYLIEMDYLKNDKVFSASLFITFFY